MKSSVSRKVFARILPFFTFYTGCLPFIILFQTLFLWKSQTSISNQCPCQQRGFTLPLISIIMKYAHIEWKMFSKPHTTHIICIYLYLLTNGYIHMRPKNELLFFTLCEAWMGFFNNLGIISILFDCRRCTYLRVT